MNITGKTTESGASEVIGSVLLISVVVMAVAIVGVVLLSQPLPQQIPVISTIISNESGTVYIRHDGGDSLTTGSYRIRVNFADVTSTLTKTGSPDVWAIGDLVTVSGTEMPSLVQVIYTGSGSSVVIASSYLAPQVSSSGPPTPASHTIISSAGSGGSISPSGSVTVSDGGSRTFSITANPGYSVADVRVDGSSIGAVSSYTFINVVADHTISATFSMPSSYIITASAGSGGTISPSGSVSVPSGNSQTFTITPGSGYYTTDVVVDGVSQGPLTSYTFTSVLSSHTITAMFMPNPVITSSATAGGTIQPLGAVSVPYGGSQTFTIQEGTGYYLSDLAIDGTSVGRIFSYTFTDVQTSHTIAAAFTPDPVITGIGPSPGIYSGGETVTITGTGFTGVTSVTIGGGAATSVSVNGDGTIITATTPPYPEGGAVDVVITTPGRAVTGTNAYRYYRIRTYLSGTTTWTVPSNVSSVEYLLVAGGGGGGYYGGGGGAGGFRTGTLTGLSGSQTVTIGAGGAGSTSGNNKGVNGGNSVFASLTATGGGGGGSNNNNRVGADGGSGGGGARSGSAGGSGTPGQGNNGGAGFTNTNYWGGGGGGASGIGANAVNNQAGAGGAGSSSSISGIAVTYAGGGGGGCRTGSAGSGGIGGGGAGGTNNVAGSDATGYGSGGGGGGRNRAGGDGSSGIIIIKYY